MKTTPTRKDIHIYFSQKRMTTSEADAFYDHCTKRGWKGRNGKPLQEWKGLAYRWIGAIINQNPLRFDKTIH